VASVTYEGRRREVGEGQTLLEALLAAGEGIAHACRAGACGACVVRATAGEIPAEAQVGLSEERKARGHFHACLCRPRASLVVEPLGDGDRVRACVVERAALSATVARVILRLAGPFEVRPGHFVTLTRGAISRSYSVASRPAAGLIEIQVRRVVGGQLSPYLCDEAQGGDELVVQGPFGRCVYEPGRPDQPILLAGTGTGLAPLWGILHDALAAGHGGPIVVIHGAVEPAGLYLVDELRAIAARHPSVRYVPSVLRGATAGVEEGPIDAVVARHLPALPGVRAVLCGSPEVVLPLRRKLFLGGIALRDLAVDAFVPAAPALC
jgi:ferredoxin-NADP reductase